MKYYYPREEKKQAGMGRGVRKSTVTTHEKWKKRFVVGSRDRK